MFDSLEMVRASCALDDPTIRVQLGISTGLAAEGIGFDRKVGNRESEVLILTNDEF